MIDLERIRLVSWDVDDTLYDTARLRRRLAFRTAWRTALGRGAEMRSALLRLRAFHRDIEAARRAGGVLGPGIFREREELLAIEQRYLAPVIAEVGCRRGVRGVLAAIGQLGIPQVVFSDFEPAYKLRALEVDWLFKEAYVGERLGRVKPDPAGLAQMSRDFGVPPEQILHIGDRADADGRAAAAAGCKSVLFTGDARKLERRLGL